jgi:hypothetical protein
MPSAFSPSTAHGKARFWSTLPEISFVGAGGRPIEDEVEFELPLKDY